MARCGLHRYEIAPVKPLAPLLLCSLLSATLLGCAGHPKTDATPTLQPGPASVASPQASAEYRSLQPQLDATRWWHDAVVYQIWPRSFKDSDGDGNGDFKGMTAKLDYVRELGANAIWLTPVFEAPSYHGYDFQDFYAIEKDYGTMADFEAFVAEAHKRDIKIILDLVINHISDQHDWFKKSARGEPGYEDYFIWRDTRPAGWGQAWSTTPNPEAVWHWNDTRKAYYYGAFGASQPDVNLRNPKVVDEMNRLAGFWLKKGVDGFRLDAVRYAIEDGPIPGQADTQSTIDYWTQFTRYVHAINPDTLLVAEAWAPLQVTGRYRDGGKGLNSAFDFDFGEMVIGILNPQSAPRVADFGTASDSARDQHRENLWNNLRERAAAAPINYFAPFLTNHDKNRTMHFLGEDVAKAKITASALLTSPGTMYLYYGEEVGVSQRAVGEDRYRRAIMPWTDEANAGFNRTGRTWIDLPEPQGYRGPQGAWWADYWNGLRGKGHSVAAQADDPDSLLNHYKRLLKVRNANVALRRPQDIRYYPVDDADVWVVRMRAAEGDAWVLINLDPANASTFAVPRELQGERADLLRGERGSVGASMTLKAGETLIF
jgi:alpha-amylase